MRIKIRVHTGSKLERVEKDKNDVLQVYINQRPIEGKANEEVIKILAKYFKIKPNRIFIESGKKTRDKIVLFSNN